jgi:hypothetical protein
MRLLKVSYGRCRRCQLAAAPTPGSIDPANCWLETLHLHMSYSLNSSVSDYREIASNYAFENPALARLCPYLCAPLPAPVLTTLRTQDTM